MRKLVVVMVLIPAEGSATFAPQTGGRCTLWPGEGARIAHLCFAADGAVLLAGLEDGTVRAWSTRDGRPRLVLESGY